jgi:hypothetical protein
MLSIAWALMIAAAPALQSAELWRQDIAVARAEFLTKDRSYGPAQRAEAERRLDELAADVPGLSDQQIVAELARVAALADNAHTRAYLLRNRGWWRRYPLRVWRFADGWRVIAVRPGLEPLLGGRIVAIGGTPVKEAEALVRPLFAGPPTWGAYMASYSLTSPDALLGTGAIRKEAANFEVEKDGKQVTLRVEPAGEAKRTVPEESWWFLSPAHEAVKGWTHVLRGGVLPPYLERPGSWYDLRRCAGGLFYLPFNRAEDQPGRPTLAAFSEDALREVLAAPGARLVIDLRFNTGGNLLKTRPMFEALAASALGQTKGRLYVIMGPTTFSAGITPAAILNGASKAIFVGSMPGDRPTFWAEGGNVPLPNSGITMHYADRAHVYEAGGPAVAEELLYLRLKGDGLAPDLPAEPRFTDYIAGRDVAAERIAADGLRCS